MPRVVEWLSSVQPDVLCMQETKLADEAFPFAALEALGYECAADGDGRYNGVAILSRVGLEQVARGFVGEPGNPGRERRSIAATCGGLRVWSVYVPNGRELQSSHYLYKLAWLKALRDAAGQELAGPAPLALCGDFNVAPSDADVWDPAAFAGLTHVTPEERHAVAELLALGLTDVQPRALKGQPFTYSVRALGRLTSPQEFEQLVVRQSNGATVRLKDIANVQLGAEDYDTEVNFSGQTAVFIGVWALPNANSLDVIKKVRVEMASLEKELPEQIKGVIAYDGTAYINSAINEKSWSSGFQ